MTWLAGLLDGEGTFFLINSRVKGKLYKYPHIALRMADEDVVQAAAEMFGTKCMDIGYGRRVDGTKEKRMYVCCVTGSRASYWMRALLPFLGKRRSEKIAEILAYSDASPDQNTLRRKWSKDAIIRRRRDAKTGRLVAEM